MLSWVTVVIYGLAGASGAVKGVHFHPLHPGTCGGLHCQTTGRRTYSSLGISRKDRTTHSELLAAAPYPSGHSSRQFTTFLPCRVVPDEIYKLTQAKQSFSVMSKQSSQRL